MSTLKASDRLCRYRLISRALVTLSAVLLLLACDHQSSPVSSADIPKISQYQFPLLEECSDLLQQSFAATQAKISDFQYELVAFNSSLRPLPNLRGYVRLSSSSLDFAALSKLANRVISSCYPLEYRPLSLHDRQLPEKLRQTRMIAKGLGAQELYPRIDDEYLYVYFAQPASAASDARELTE